ncbi:Uu.00g086890.m01.CDS01 [Anthostomella pinea]|uniref:Uu.00g086890.m01.CDS01 n=1 Tax=Anthostomella pinea TaxID=933095 RepID=A0AAI8YK27_9PEZI|nr:Uu.00g086890.m01.CDS01 [Anthostomella pinea]
MKGFLQSITGRLNRPSGLHLQLLSDLHLEVAQQYSTFTFPAVAPFLLLAGDIGRLIDYAGYLVFLEAQVARAQELSEEPSLVGRLILLNKTRWDDPASRLTILGCTLWSAIPLDIRDIVKSKVSDFKKIDGWTVEKHDHTHAEEAEWLRKQVSEVTSQEGDSGRKLIVVTHHAPCMQGTSRPADSANPWTPAFATDLVGHEEWRGINTWVFGHMHYSTDLVRDGIRVVANQRGYVLPGSAAYEAESDRRKKRGKHDFEPSMVIVI